MKLKNRNLICTGCLLLCLLFSVNAEESVMFNYQGRVKVQGSAFDGSGLFKFAIINNSGSRTLWSNDLTSTGGGEPTNHIEIPVVNGVFDTIVGDPDLGMEAINSSIFNNPNKIKLRIWFSDGTHGFQHLNPDRKLINTELMGTSSGTDDFTLYVNGTTGDDENSGLVSSSPKKTIQSAVNVLPERIKCNITIDVADGIYREQVNIFGITVEEGKFLTLTGDESWTLSSTGDPAVRITGKDDDVSGSPVRDYAFIMRQASGVLLKGILFDYGDQAGFRLSEGTCSIEKCKASNNGVGGGFVYAGSANGSVDDCLAEDNARDGFSIGNFGGPVMTNVKAKNNVRNGLYISRFGTVSLYGTANEFSGNTYGIHVAARSRIGFNPADYSCEIKNNSTYGLYITEESNTKYHTMNTYSGNGTPVNSVNDVVTNTGGQTW
jgi:parallel beta helix pectate lyase-like protein